MLHNECLEAAYLAVSFIFLMSYCFILCKKEEKVPLSW